MKYCNEIGEDGKCNSLFAWLEIECINCNAKQNLRDYHTSYRIPIKDKNGSIIREGKFLLLCPSCKKEMELESFNLKTIEDDKIVAIRKEEV